VLGQIGKQIATLVLCVLNYVSSSIARKVARPDNIGVALVLARGNWIAANRGHDRSVAQSWLGGDYRVCDEMIKAGMLLLLDLQDGTVLERPLENVRLGRCTFDRFGLAE